VQFFGSIALIPAGYTVVAALLTDQTPAFAYLFSLIITSGGATLFQISKRYENFPISDIGFTYVGTILLYFLIPTLKFILSGYEWGLLSDIRLFDVNPSQHQLMPLLFCFLAYTLAFGVSYLKFLQKAHAPTFASNTSRTDPNRLFGVLVLLFVFRQVFALTIGASSDYNDKVNSVADQPLILRQLYFFLQSVVFGVGLITMVVAVMQYERKRFIFWLVLLVFAVPPVVTLGSRHEAFTFILLAAILYHCFVKPIATRRLVIGGLILLVTMLVLGFVRSYTDGGSVLLASTEFEAMFATFYHINSNGAAASPPWTVYLSDVLSLLPQQLLPFSKLDPATWYMKEFFPEVAEENPEVGYGFGVISEASIGFGIPELIIRGLLLGYIFAKMANYFNGRSRNPIFAFVYLFCVITVFRTFRTSSFELLKSVSFYIVPGIVFYEFLKKSKRKTRPQISLENPAA